MLADPKASITETIYASGFNTKSNFNREFARVTGKTPSEWRNLSKPRLENLDLAARPA